MSEKHSNIEVAVTGMHGFAGSCFVRRVMEQTDWNVVSLERLPGATRRERLSGVLPSSRVRHVYHDFRAPFSSDVLRQLDGIKYFVHAGAEVHALRSLSDPGLFVESNVLGTFHVLEAVRHLAPEKFLYTSTAEVLGAIKKPMYSAEDAQLRPSNPYAATKAAGELLLKSYLRAYGVMGITVRTMNFFGEMQSGGKYIPETIKKILRGDTVDIHVDENGNAGSRQWLYAEEFSDAMLFILDKGTTGQTYHVVGHERDNLQIAKGIAEALGRSLNVRDKQMTFTHEPRYALADTKLKPAGWAPSLVFEDTLQMTVRWAADHQEWL